MEVLMDCPKCIGKLDKNLFGTFESKPFHVDHCFLCGGWWFDKGELAMAYSLNHAIVKVADDEAEPTKTYDHMNEKEALCPRCRVPMVKMPSFRDARIKTDECPNCQGVWLDKEELPMLSRGGYFRRLLNRFMKSFRDYHRAKNTRYPGDPRD